MTDSYGRPDKELNPLRLIFTQAGDRCSGRASERTGAACLGYVHYRFGAGASERAGASEIATGAICTYEATTVSRRRL